jgi:two-component system chemotaxis response regulator CheY
LAAKSLETVRLTETLSVSPEDDEARGALWEHLSHLRESARELGLVHLEAAVAEAMSRLEQDTFGPASLVVVGVLAWRYETLAAMPNQSGTHRVVGEETPPAPKVSLRGRRVLVAEGEAEVRWSYVGALREAGARVVEARDGVHALELTRDAVPDLILGAVEMPRLDGLGLCDALRREPAFDGVPVVLLSKPVAAQEVLDRISRALGPLVRLEQWLASDLEATGDLEELGVSGLIRAVRRLRPNATMVLQDPWSLFDLELREGHIVGVTRTAVDGVVTEGVAAFPQLVGMSSGRFVVAESPPIVRGAERESLDAPFAQATHRLGVLLSTMAAHVDCRVDLDQDALATYVRHSPIAVQRLVTRLVAGEPPNALWESGAGSRGLVDAVLVTLARQGAIKDVRVPGLEAEAGQAMERSRLPRRELITSENQQDSKSVADSVERENIRAQLAVAMHREPANLAPSASHPIWRLTPNVRSTGGERGSGFVAEMQTMPRILGFAFVVLLCATVGLILWRQVTRGPTPTGSSPVRPAAATTPAELEGERHARAPVPAPRTGVSAFSGKLRNEVDPSLGVTEGQGVLELNGPGDVRVEVDGVDRGALPVTLVLAAGTHAARYRGAVRSTYRFYYVRSGATRGVRIFTQAGGLVDVR